MVISQVKIASAIEEFIRREFRVRGDDHNFSRDVHLYDSGYVDSVGVVELIAFIESTFDVKLEDEHLFGGLFTTINGISSVCVGLM
jgi:acyl carrier protein